MTKSISAKILIFVVAIVTLGCYGWAIGLHSLTFVAWWGPLSVALLLSLATSLLLRNVWRPVTSTGSVWINTIVHTVVATGVLLAAFYAINYYGASAESSRTIKAEIERKYQEERHRSRRVGRRYVASGDAYQVYYADFRLPDGRLHKQRLTPARYIKLRRGSHITLHLRRGLLGLDVIKN
ncbi:MAG: hypothetical protein NC339_02100 [Muribaculaceae bacterium]|nr:hypothetical protein [Muribaculaceae bacterium]